MNERVTDEEMTNMRPRSRHARRILKALRAEREHAHELLQEHLRLGQALAESGERERKALAFAREAEALQHAQAARLAEVEVELEKLRNPPPPEPDPAQLPLPESKL